MPSCLSSSSIDELDKQDGIYPILFIFSCDECLTLREKSGSSGKRFHLFPELPLFSLKIRSVFCSRVTFTGRNGLVAGRPFWLFSGADTPNGHHAGCPFSGGVYTTFL